MDGRYGYFQDNGLVIYSPSGMSEISCTEKDKFKKSLARSAAGERVWLEFIYYVDYRMVLWICSCHAMFSNLRFSHVRK